MPLLLWTAISVSPAAVSGTLMRRYIVQYVVGWIAGFGRTGGQHIGR